MSFTEGLVILSMGAFSCLLGVFQLVGFFNFPLRLHRRSGLAVGEHQWSSSICWIIQLIVTMVNGVLAKRNYNCLFNGLLLKDAMNNYFKFTLGLLTAIVTLADSWFCVETHRSIWMRYRALAQRDGTFLGLMDRGVTVHVLVRYMATFLLVVAVCILVEYKLYYGIAVGTQWHCFWMHNIYPYAISHFRHMFHLLHIALMAENLSQLQARLQRSIEQAGLHSGPVQRDATVALIMEECRAIYTELWFVNESINELFGFSQAFNIACSFAQIAFDLYWVYSIWLTNQENIDVQMFCFILTPIIVGFLMQAIKSHQLAVEALEATVLEIPCGKKGSRIHELRAFFLCQLYRNRLRLTARNIFDFDYTLIRKLAIVTLTYMVIFIEISG